jgi:cell wall-associated NlpC family hydrolase
MKKSLFILILLFSLHSCKSSKETKPKKDFRPKIITKKSDVKEMKQDSLFVFSETENPVFETNISTSQSIVNYAKQFEGVRYKWGGTTKFGMDCSGLVFESFREHDIILPRISRDMAKKGEKIKLKNVLKGDLLFFKTGNRRNSINHVGLIVDIRDNDIKFIHATSGNGVIISGLNEAYWLKAFYEARRIL